jgi:TrmH family RNA methyltransferase
MQLSKSTQQLIRSLQQAKFRNQHRLFTAEGIKTVHDLFNYGFKLHYLITCVDTEISATLTSYTEHYVVNREIMERISALTTPPGILGVFGLPEITVSELPSTTYWSLVLDGIKDPGNMGTLIRTAHWFGIKNLFLTNHCVDIFSPKTVQSSMGSLGAVTIQKIENIEQWALLAKNAGYPLYATSLTGIPLQQCKPSRPGGIIMGSESHGIDPVWENYLTENLLIPALSNNPPDSLNVAVSAGIILHYLCSPEIR